MILSRHFLEKWGDLVGGDADENMVRRLINHSICVQKGQMIYEGSGQSFCVPAIFWNIAEKVMFKVDEQRNTVITVYVGWQRNRKDRRA